MFKITFLDKLSRGIPPQKMAPMDRQQTPPELVILGAIGHTPKICLLLTWVPSTRSRYEGQFHAIYIYKWLECPNVGQVKEVYWVTYITYGPNLAKQLLAFQTKICILKSFENVSLKLHWKPLSIKSCVIVLFVIDKNVHTAQGEWESVSYL